MKKLTAIILTFICAVSVAACSVNNTDNINTQAETTNTTYKVRLADNYPIENTLNNTCEAGEQVTIKLGRITEGYYEVYVNGVKQDFDTDAFDSVFIYYTFTMPSKDVLIEIKEVSVDIP
ncbi:MAG: hypothetical protein IJD14_05730 [Christensenellaceae bacterium]|nr:hypothetical protein [Christensenellaceae bacterium]